MVPSSLNSLLLDSITLKFRLFILLICSIFFTNSALASAEKIQVGDMSSDSLLSHFENFKKSFENYQLSNSETAALAQLPDGVEVTVYFGTWCHDSEREVGRLLKSVTTQPDKLKVSLYGLDYNKSDPLGLAKKAQVKYTPTIVVYYQGEEIGRIVERPKQGLIADIQLMLTSSVTAG